MKTLIAAVALTLVTGAAMAEGNGEPFPNTMTSGRVVNLQKYQPAKERGIQNPYPFTAPGTPMAMDQVLPTNGSQGPVQTANSLPVGFDDGPAAMATLNHTPRATQYAQPGTVQSQIHG